MKIKYPVIVEGKYDKIKITSLFEATVITTDGFGIFNKKEKLSLIRSLAQKGKIILLTDSDGGGHLIRSYIKTAISPDKIINLYTPKIEGKEKRKTAASKEGILGVEGTDKDILYSLLSPFCEENGGGSVDKTPITKADLYAYGLSGRADSKQKREILLIRIGLPHDMTANAMLLAINILYTKEEFENLI
jgi:ribonuclease M5